MKIQGSGSSFNSKQLDLRQRQNKELYAGSASQAMDQVEAASFNIKPIINSAATTRPHPKVVNQ